MLQRFLRIGQWMSCGLAASCLAASVIVGTAIAEGDASSIPLRFIDALRDRGYGDTAVEYLDQLEAAKQLPGEMADTLDLKRSELLQAAAEKTPDAESRERLLAKSREYRQKFVQSHPNHPAVIAVSLEEIQRAADDAQRELARAQRDTTDKKKEMLTAARESLKAARSRFAAAELEFRGKGPNAPSGDKPEVNAKPATSEPPADDSSLSETAKAGIGECQLNIAVLTYQIALTYTDISDPERTEAFTSAAEQLDGLRRSYGGASDIGIRAQVWSGKLAEDRGNLQDALDIYDEALVLEPEPNELSAQSFDFFAQVFLFRLRLQAKLEKEQEVIFDAGEWMKTHEQWQDRAAYVAVKLETAKVILAQKDKVPSTFRTRMQREAMSMLVEISKVDSPYRTEALALRRQYLNSQAPSSGTELMATASSAEESGRLQEALDAYEKALQSAENTKDTNAANEAKQGMDRVRYAMAVKAYEAKDMEKAYLLAGELVQKSANELTKSLSAGVALAAARALYQRAGEADRPARLTKLETVARYILDHWPAANDADEARVVLAQIQHTRGDVAGAAKLYAEIRPESRRYAAAMLLAGKMHLASYVETRPKDSNPTAENRAQLEKAVLLLTASARAFDRQAKTDEASSAQWLDVQTCLGQAMIEAKKFQEASASLSAAMDKIGQSTDAQNKAAIEQLCALSIKASTLAGNLAQAGKAAELLAKTGADNQEVNSQLLSYSSALQKEIRRLAGPGGETNPAGGSPLPANQPATESLRKAQTALLEQLSKRKQMSAAGMAFVGNACAELNLNPQARAVYERILNRAVAEPEFRESDQKLINSVRLRFVDILRSEGKFAEAAKEAERLIEDNPKALEPRLLKARTLQAWAIKEPAHYDEAIAAWTSVRLLLGRIQKKPPEYFDATYNAALCLVYQAGVSKDASKAQQAEQLLNTAMTLAPNLNGPETVQRYKALLQRASEEKKKLAARPK